MSTLCAKADSITHGWFVVDVKSKVVGRLAAEIARHLRGKIITVLIVENRLRRVCFCIKEKTRLR